MFLIIWFLKPGYFDTINAIDLFYNVGRVFSIAYIFYYYINKNKIPVESLILGLFYFCQIFSTFINQGDVSRSIRSATLNWGAFTTCLYVFRTDGMCIYRILLPIIRVLVYINFLTIILYPNGMYTTTLSTGWESEMNWFLGLRNGQTPWLICAFFLEWSNYIEFKRKKGVRLFFILTIIALLGTVVGINAAQIKYAFNQSTAGGTLFGMAVCIGLWLIPNKIMTSGIINLKSVYITNFTIFILVVIVRIQEVFSYFIEIILKKDLTLTNRTMIWDNALSYLNKRWIIGSGYKGNIDMANILGAKGAISTTHNSFLDILFFGGILSLILILFFILYIDIKNKKNNKNKGYVVIIYAIGAILLTGQFEGSGFGTCFFICIAAICGYTSYILEKEMRKDCVK